MVQHAPAFEVEKLDGTRQRTIHIPKKGGGFDTKTVEVAAGYMVYFPRGHSIRVSEEELKAQGFDKAPNLIDMETGEEVSTPRSLKSHVTQKTKSRHN